MERESFVVNGGIKMPIGYRFQPTDEELVVHYLKPKVLNLPLPASVIPDFDVFRTDPWGLPGDLSERKRYFFSNGGKVNAVRSNCRRATGSGYWKTIGKHKMILAPQSNQVIGTRKTLAFKPKKHLQESKTRWFLHQFCLLSSSSTPKPIQMEVQDWVVYSLFQKKRKPKKIEGLSSRSGFADLMVEMEKSPEMGPPQASSCSSGVTDQDCSNELAASLDQEASSTYINVFSSFSCMREDH